MLAVCSAGTKSGVASRPLTLHRDSDDTHSAYSEGSDSDLDELDEANAYCYFNYDEVPRTIHDAAHDMYFQILGRLGFGSFGTVQRALYLPDYKSCGLRIIPGIGIVAVARREVPCAIKIMHKDKIYQYHGGRCGVRQEERALKRATHSGLFGLTTAWAMWDDAINVYFAMVYISSWLVRLLCLTCFTTRSSRCTTAIFLNTSATLKNYSKSPNDCKPSLPSWSAS